MKEVLDFLNSIEGAGYGGMASFEIARSTVKDAVSQLEVRSDEAVAWQYRIAQSVGWSEWMLTGKGFHDAIAADIAAGTRDAYQVRALYAHPAQVAPVLTLLPPSNLPMENDPDVLQVARAIAERGIGRYWDDFPETDAFDTDQGDLIEYARAAVEIFRRSAPQPPIVAQASPEICARCMGSGYSNHPDSGEICQACGGQGIEPPSEAPTKLTLTDITIHNNAVVRSIAAQEAKHCGAWQPIETAPKDGTEVLVWCDEGPDISQYSEREEDGSDSMGHDAGWWGTRQPMDPGRHMGNPEYFREAENQPWAWMPIDPPYDAEGEKLFATSSVPSAQSPSDGEIYAMVSQIGMTQEEIKTINDAIDTAVTSTHQATP